MGAVKKRRNKAQKKAKKTKAKKTKAKKKKKKRTIKKCEDPFIRLWIDGKEENAPADIMKIFLQENGDPDGPGLTVLKIPKPELLKMARQQALELLPDRKMATPGVEYWQGAQKQILDAFKLLDKGATCKTIAIMCNRPYEKTRANLRWLKDVGLLKLHKKTVTSKKPLKRASHLHYFELPPEAPEDAPKTTTDIDMQEPVRTLEV